MILINYMKKSTLNSGTKKVKNFIHKSDANELIIKLTPMNVWIYTLGQNAILRIQKPFIMVIV